MEFKKQGQIFELSASIKLPIGLEEAWNFLSDPANLKTITPDYMGFHILSDLGQKMYAGQIISYKVTPLLGIKVDWVTEITHVEHHSFFVDEQRFGPYSMWHHKHFVKEIKGGTEMNDIIHYRLPFPIVSNLFHNVMVKPKLKEIFGYRTEKLTELFGAYD